MSQTSTTRTAIATKTLRTPHCLRVNDAETILSSGADQGNLSRLHAIGRVLGQTVRRWPRLLFTDQGDPPSDPSVPGHPKGRIATYSGSAKILFRWS